MAAAQMIVQHVARALSLAWVTAFAAGCGNSSTSGSATAMTESVVIGGEKFTLELAVDFKSRERGLMNRTSIPDHGGMLFVFPDSLIDVQQFWMGHCLVDMDIIYLDSRGTVTASHRMKAEPPQRPDETDDAYGRRMRRYSSGYPAQFAIELQAGSLDRLNIHVDDRLPLNLDRLKALAR